MSAANAKAQEPSMEEILASIRRIIADEPTPGATAEKAPEPAAARMSEAPIAAIADDSAPQEMPAQPEDDILDLDEESAVAATQESVLPQAQKQAEAFQSPQDLEFVDSQPPRPDVPVQPNLSPAERLVSPQTDAVVNQAFNSLANTMFTQNARSIEDLVREMLRPMLKVWLDDNLPTIVERLVRAEIERVARGGR